MTAKVRRLHFHFFICLTFAFCASETVYAQSGRRVATTVPETTPPAGAQTSNIPNPAAPAAAVIVGGELVQPYAFFRSNMLDLALKECVNSLRESGVRNTTKGGTMKFNEAKARAGKETDAYVLWISFVGKDDGYGNMLIERADYALLSPKTSRRVTFGEVRPGAANVIATGGRVLTIPSARTRQSTTHRTLEALAREIAATLVHGGWLQN
jgi:hypothetical protein